MQEDHLHRVIRRLEERLLSPEVQRSPVAVAALLADDFVEFGSSGRTFNKQQIVDALQIEQPISVAVTDFRVRSLSPGLALATYRAVRSRPAEDESVTTLRSSLWRKIEGQWQMVFHQGTLAGEK